MAPDQCIFVSATYDTKRSNFWLSNIPGVGIRSTLLSIKIRNHYHKYKKDTATTTCCLFYILCSFLRET